MSKKAPGFKETEEEVQRQLQEWPGLTYEQVTDLADYGELNHDVFWHPQTQESLRTFVQKAELSVGYRLSIDEFGHIMTSGKFTAAARQGSIKLSETLAVNSVEKEFEAKADPEAISAILFATLGDITGVPDTLKALVKKDSLELALRQKRMQVIQTKIEHETKTYTELRIQSVGHNGRFVIFGGRKVKIEIKLTVMKYEYHNIPSGANLRGANLGQAGLSQADLCEANLSGAKLFFANLSGTNLRETLGLKQDQINVTKGNEKTTLPTGLIKPRHWLDKSDSG